MPSRLNWKPPSRICSSIGAFFEHQDTVEQGFAPGKIAPALDVGQRRVFKITHVNVQPLQRAQPLTKRCFGIHRHPQRQGVDEQADHLRHSGQLRRTTGHGDAEQHVPLTAIARQQQRPDPLEKKRVRGDPAATAECSQRLGFLLVQVNQLIVHQHRIGVAVTGYAVVHGQWRGCIEPLQLAAPELLGLARILALQPLDVIAKRPWALELRRAVVAQRFVDFEEVHGHQGNAPGVHQDMVKAANEFVGFIGQSHQAEANQRRLRQVETDFLLVFQQRADPRFLFVRGEPAQV